MAAPDASPPQQDRPQGFHPTTHGNWAQWVAIVVALVLPFILKQCDRGASQDAENFSLRVDKRIDEKLGPAVDKINDHIDKKVDALSTKVDLLTERVARLEGPLTNRVSDLEKSSKQQASLARLIDPARVLAAIRAGLKTAESTGRVIPASDISDYRNAAQALPTSAHEYWTTVAAIINYQSLVNQMSGDAPDPSVVSRECGLFGPSAHDNLFRNVRLSKCRINLDNNVFEGVTFKDSVIIYRGAKVSLANVTFLNCRFVLELSAQTKPSNPDLLLTLLNSTTQKTITVD